MGIVAFLGVVSLLVGVWALFIWVRLSAAGSGGLWLARGILLVALFLTLWAVNAFVSPIESPFDGPKATDLPAHDRERKPPPPLELKAPERPSEFDKATAEHRERMREFEKGPATP
jgi:hypothetical protein